MSIRLRRTDDAFQFEATNSRGNTITLDTSPEQGGQGSGPGPMELVAMAAAGCSSIDIVSILKKGRHGIESFEVDVHTRRAETLPKVYTWISLDYHLTGEIDPKAIARAIELSLTKYCSVTTMLKGTAQIEYGFTLNGERHAEHVPAP